MTNKPAEADPKSLGRLLEGRTPGQPQRKGRLEMIPLTGSPVPEGLFAPPETGLGLNRVHTYGVMELVNKTAKPAIVPLHLGYFQQGAQNHAMCRAAMLPAEKTVVYDDACCIQASQGGYIQDHDARFIVLPHNLRKAAFGLRGKKDYSKLWGHISRFNQSIGLKNRGHLDELKQNFQPELIQCMYQFEQIPGQTGAIFLCEGKVVGIELAPDTNFWAELHNPLVMYTYAPLKLQRDKADAPFPKGLELDTEGLTSGEDLLRKLEALESARQKLAEKKIDEIGGLETNYTKEETSKNGDLFTVEAGDFRGQAVVRDRKPAYVSLFNAAEFQIA